MEAKAKEVADLKIWVKNNKGVLTLISILSVALLALIFLVVSNTSTISALTKKVSASLEGSSRVSAQSLSAASKSLQGENSVGQEGSLATSDVTANLAGADKHPVKSDKFPGAVQGPAIVEWWDGKSEEGIFRLREGESFSFDGEGTWWQFADSAALDARYPTHRAEYFNSHPKGAESPPKG